jgi:hypothetical protein
VALRSVCYQRTGKNRRLCTPSTIIVLHWQQSGETFDVFEFSRFLFLTFNFAKSLDKARRDAKSRRQRAESWQGMLNAAVAGAVEIVNLWFDKVLPLWHTHWAVEAPFCWTGGFRSLTIDTMCQNPFETIRAFRARMV